MNDKPTVKRVSGKWLLLASAIALPAVSGCAPVAAQQAPVELADPLVGTAPLDDPAVIGNAPPPVNPIIVGLV